MRKSGRGREGGRGREERREGERARSESEHERESERQRESDGAMERERQHLELEHVGEEQLVLHVDDGDGRVLRHLREGCAG